MPTEKTKAEEPAIELPPFEVRTDKDVGYAAQNTTSGSRLNTSLADTPAAISVFTKEFMEDIGAAKIEDLVEYSVNSRSNFLEGASLNADSPQGQGTALTNNDATLSVRGIAGAARFSNSFQSSVSQDTFNIERAELTRGPNSVLAGMFQSRQAGAIENQQEEVLIQNPFATVSPDEGNGNLNRVRRRTYLGTSLHRPSGELGLQDYRAFPLNALSAVTSIGTPVTTLPVTTTFVPFGQTRDTFRRTNSSLYVWQGNLLFDRLVATLGYREDRVRTILPDTTLRAAPFPPFPQGILIPGRSQNETFGGGVTRSQGLVAKPVSWLSLFYNRSSSFDVPAQTVIILNNVPPPSSRGLTEDYGVKFSLLNGRVFATVTRYETSAQDQTGNTGVQSFVTNANLIWDTLEAAGVPEAVGTSVFANGRTFDRTSTGWEFELTANLTSNWRLILNYSANQTLQGDHAREIIDYYDQLTPLYTAGTRSRLIIGGTPGQMAASAIDPADAVTTIAERLQEVRADFQDQFISPDGVRQLGQPVAQGNVRTTYAFREGLLKGVSVGGGARWRGERVIGYTSAVPASRREIRGDATITTDVNASYRWKVGLLGRKWDLTVQLNINNALNDDDLIITRTFADGTPRTFSIPSPRQWFLTTTVRY